MVVVQTSVARAMELVLGTDPGNGAAQMRAFPVESHHSIHRVDEIEFTFREGYRHSIDFWNAGSRNRQRLPKRSSFIRPEEAHETRANLGQNDEDSAKCGISHESSACDLL